MISSKNNMEIKSFSKINICLKIFKKTKGEIKHRIDSIFYLYKSLYDTIDIKPSDTLIVKYFENGKNIKIDDCLVNKTLLYLNKKYNIDINYCVTINKNIPIGSGLGGGSSNAASIIKFLLNMYPHIKLDMKEIALQLGSDIPFFLFNYELARVKEYGNKVEKLNNINLPLDLIQTGVASSSKNVFDLLDKDSKFKSTVDVDTIWNNILSKQHNVVYNDLTKYIIMNNQKLQDWLKKNQDYWFTGSGSSLVKIKDEYYESKN